MVERGGGGYISADLSVAETSRPGIGEGHAKIGDSFVFGGRHLLYVIIFGRQSPRDEFVYAFMLSTHRYFIYITTGGQISGGGGGRTYC